MKRNIVISFAVALVASLLVACGGSETQPVTATPIKSLNAIFPHPVQNASTVSGSAEIAIHTYQALYGQAPSYAQLSAYMSQIGTSDGFLWANAIAASFNGMSDSAFSTLVLNNISVTPTSLTSTALFGTGLQAYDALQAALADYLRAAGIANRGIVVVQLAEIISNLEGDATFGVYGVAATSFNKQVSVNLAYSTNTADTVAAAVSTSIANAGVPQNATVGSLVTLDGSASKADVGRTLTYAWTLASKPTGSSAVLSSATADKPTFTADTVGTYLASLAVNDGRLSSSSATVSVTATVVNVAPVANAGPAQSVAAGTLVTLDGSASSDANNDALTYSWSLTSKPAGSGAALLSSTSVRPTFTADVAGTYVASLTVNDGKVSSSAATVSVTATSLTNLTLTLPARSIHASQLAVIVAAGDKLSEDIASYYQNARGIPAANIVRVTLTTGVETISATDFATLKAQIDAALPSNVQATLLTWNAPSRVVGSCAMGITSAMALGFDAKYCATSCATTAASPYYDSESALPWVDHKLRPSMMLGASTLAAAKTLIDRGVQADASLPTGDGYLLRTSDANRSVRYTDYAALPGLWAGNSGLQLSYIDNSAGAVSDGISGKSNVLFYFTGLAGVPPALTSNSFRPGALADSLTSTGGYLPGGNGQMPITAWLDAGATASYGTVEEPCNYTQKFSRASVLIDQYYRGATLIEAYWKAVQWPGQGLFIGEPLAQPFRDSPSFSVDAGQYLISTRALRANSSYSLQYQSTSAGSWVTLGSFKVTRAQPQSWRVSLPPGNATQLRWLGPCPANAALQCTLSTSP